MYSKLKKNENNLLGKKRNQSEKLRKNRQLSKLGCQRKSSFENKKY